MMVDSVGVGWCSTTSWTSPSSMCCGSTLSDHPCDDKPLGRPVTPAKVIPTLAQLHNFVDCMAAATLCISELSALYPCIPVAHDGTRCDTLFYVESPSDENMIIISDENYIHIPRRYHLRGHGDEPGNAASLTYVIPRNDGTSSRTSIRSTSGRRGAAGLVFRTDSIGQQPRPCTAIWKTGNSGKSLYDVNMRNMKRVFHFSIHVSSLLDCNLRIPFLCY